MQLVEDYFMWGKDIKLLVEDLTGVFRSILMIKIFGNADHVLDFNEEYRLRLLENSDRIDTDELIRVLNLLSEAMRSEEHTSELQSRQYLVCRLLLEKKKKNYLTIHK